MALTAAQKTTLYLALGIPQRNTIEVFGPSKGVNLVYTDSVLIDSIIDALTTRLTEIALNADEEAKLIVMLTSYETVQTQGTGDIKDGDVGEIRRITQKANDQRDFIRMQIQVLLGIKIPKAWLDSIGESGSTGGPVLCV